MEDELIQKLKECISAIKCCGFEIDSRGAVWKPEIGQSFVESIEKLIQKAEK